jgi:hypothetical protein
MKNFLHCVRFGVSTAVTTKIAVFWDVTPITLIRTGVSEQRTVFIIRVEAISELGINVTSD